MKINRREKVFGLFFVFTSFIKRWKFGNGGFFPINIKKISSSV
jgi:hypothetical protein